MREGERLQAPDAAPWRVCPGGRPRRAPRRARRPGRKPGQIDRGLRVPGALEHPARAAAQRQDVAGANEVPGDGATGSASARSVRARSEAEMPVVTPRARSTVTVNAVRCASWLSLTISGRSSSSSCDPGRAAQMTPDVCSRKNASDSVVAASAAMMKSPSFSRSMSSVTMTTSPRPIAARAFTASADILLASPRRNRLRVRRRPRAELGRTCSPKRSISRRGSSRQPSGPPVPRPPGRRRASRRSCLGCQSAPPRP